MNFLKKKLKPLTSGLTTTNSASNSHNKSDKDLEDDLYDEYVVEAPPHPSELLALGIDPTEIDANDPDKLRELYRKAKEEGKDKNTNSVLLARQRQKEEIEEKKKTREEWKFFDSLTARVEQAVKDSQKTLEHLKESSAVDKLTEPEYELRLSADEVFKSSKSVKQEKGPDNWVDFDDDGDNSDKIKKEDCKEDNNQNKPDVSGEELGEFGCARKKSSIAEPPEHIAKELLEDFGFDIRPKSRDKSPCADISEKSITPELAVEITQKSRLDIDLKSAARPRPRPNGVVGNEQEKEVDPFDTSFIASPVDQEFLDIDQAEEKTRQESKKKETQAAPRALDPFDTSFVDF